MGIAERFTPGELVSARGREWVVVGSGDTALEIRPLTASEDEIETIIPELEVGPVTQASFDPPDGKRKGGRGSAQLLRDALRLSLRRGAGPFRSAGRLNFEPRAYQFAPLMMALRLDTTRLLIADDVGIGKTIEAGLILREMLDRGEIRRFTVLCPPHLVEQWTGELESKFSIPATPVTASAAARLERDLPDTQSIFEAYPYTVASLDFVKADRRFADFQRACPEMVVVDEAHTATSGGRGRQLRYKLVRSLSEKRDRHMVFLTATPHSGDEVAFDNLLGLIHKDFEQLPKLQGEKAKSLREKLARHFIQRRRKDIDAWREPGLFPQHETSEIKYRLAGEHEAFFEEIVEYCAETVRSEEGDLRQRLAFWGMLALMRCVGSSPAAAERALNTRARTDVGEMSEQQLAAKTLDDEELPEDDDLEPAAGIDDPRLSALIAKAKKLKEDIDADPKYRKLVEALKQLTSEGYSPVVFCRYIATAEAIGNALPRAFGNHEVIHVTGAFPSEEREALVEELGQKEKRILVATDCLSEGINLQHWFNAVIHYDLSWNPTRHQQREGRIDRFGQKSQTVRSVLMYGENNPVDGAVLKVILRKAKEIEKRTGVRVPLPDESGSLMKALMSAVLLRANKNRQMTFDLESDDLDEVRKIDLAWENASEKEKKSNTIFAQRTLKPEEVLREWDATQTALGGYEDTERFVVQAMKRLNAALAPLSGNGYKAPIHLAPEWLKERFITESLIEEAADKPIRIGFAARPPAGCVSVHRSHPLPVVLAESFLEKALDQFAREDDLAALPRAGAWESSAAEEVIWLAILRIRHRLNSKGKLGPNFNMAEEAAAIAISATQQKRLCAGADAFNLLEVESGNLQDTLRDQKLAQGIAALPNLEPILNAYAEERAQQLSEDHTRVRQALKSQAKVDIHPALPVDVIGFHVLMPKL